MKIDAHQHFWKYNSTEYAWIPDSMKVLRRDFLPEDLLKELKKTGFEGSVAVQARQTLEETRWLLKLADEFNFIKGVVGWIDLCSPGAADQLSEFSSHRKFAGVRHVLQDEPDDQFMLRENFLKGIGLLREYDLVYEILIFPKHLPYAASLVEKFPGQKFVLDHIAKPLIKDKSVSPWKEGIRELALHPNVYCKLSGMVTEASRTNRKKDDFTPYLDVVFDSFGPSRLMIGSDWPVCTVVSDYQEVMRIVIDYIGKRSQKDLELVLGRNAEIIYNL
jgi:L-fuconolactonase